MANLFLRPFRAPIASLLALFTALFSPSAANASEDVFYGALLRQEIQPNASFNVADTNTASIVLLTRVRNVVWFSVDEEYYVKDAPFTATLPVLIEKWDRFNNPLPSETVTFTVHFESDEGARFAFTDKYEFANAFRMKITVLSPGINCSTCPVTSFFKLEAKIIVDKDFNFDCSEPAVFKTTAIDTTSNAVIFGWNKIDGAEEYDFEWSFYDAEDQLPVSATVPTHDFDLLFRNNATRVTVPHTTFAVPMVYPSGTIFVRMRPVQYSGNIRYEGRWSSLKNAAILLGAYPANEKYVIDPARWHEQNLNWMAQLVFAEEGKKTHSIQYFDGALYGRQNAVRSDATNIVTVSETVYDAQGRPAVQVMPAPVAYTNFGQGDKWLGRLRYLPLFSADPNGGIFDKSDLYVNSCTAGLQAPPMSPQASAVGRYYSPFNPRRDDYMNKYIPDAEGWPFALTEYTPDNTGRIKRQSGVGVEFSPGADHATRFFYAKPDQNELDRLFGNEVGRFSHYQKNMAIDPHKQVSVTYIDAHGRTIATALAGPTPANLSPLVNNPNGNSPITKNLLDNALEGSTLVTNTTLMVTSTDNSGDFYYLVSPLHDTIDICLSNPRCYDCLYDLEITIQDDCGNHYTPGGVPFRKTNHTLTELDTICGNIAHPLQSGIVSGTLQPGTYQITKKLSVSQYALQYYVEDYIRHITCLPPLDSIIQTLSDPPDCDFSCQDCLDQVGTQQAFVDEYLSIFQAPTQADRDRAAQLYQEALAECQEFCKDDNDCDIILAAVIGDLSPGGQYALYGTTANGFVDTLDAASIFFTNNLLYKHPTTPYLDENGLPDTVEIDGVKYLPQELSVDDFIRSWEPSWVKSLLTYHPEYCYYECCLQQVNFHDYDIRLEKINTYAEAVALGFLPASGLLNNDPLFQPTTGGPYITMQDLLFYNYSNVGFPDCGPHLGLVQIIQSAIYCDGAIPCVDTLGCTAENDAFWIALRTAYITLRRHYKFLEMEKCVQNDPDPHCKISDEYCFGKPACAGQPNPNPYQFKNSRILKVDLPPANVEAAIQDLIAQAQAELTGHCQETCEQNADLWIDTLKVYCSLVQSATQGQLYALRYRLVELCKAGCDGSHPFGSITSNSNGSSLGDFTIKDAIEHTFNTTLTDCDNGCTANILTFPGTFDQPKYLAPRIIINQPEECICEKLDAFEACYGLENMAAYINLLSGQPISQADLLTLRAACNDTCKYLPYEVVIPPPLDCDVCKPYREVENAFYRALNCVTQPVDPAEQLYMERFINNLLGLNLSYGEYSRFLGSPHTDCSVLCPKVIFPVSYPDSCVDTWADRDTVLANLILQNWLDSLRKGFIDHYLAKCLGPQVHEIFTYTTEQSEYQYTLYYYDQAGNLLKTIPPAGVHPLADAQVLEVQAHRNDPANAPNPVYPAHTLVTRYWYNTLNQLVRDSTPDRDITRYWYDQLGRLTFSQTKRQAGENRFSYLLYEPLGRVIESGVVKLDNPLTHPAPGSIFVPTAQWLSGNGSEWREITRSYYDDVMDPTNADIEKQFGFQGQENLRNRIATTTHRQTPLTTGADYLDKNLYEFGTHFSYDIGGNVKTMAQEIRPLADLGHHFKKIEYQYDLVSGKVNYVYYQRDSIDQFIHHYAYDADNRLLYVETSTNGALWERDAQNEYYLHGPLYRMELGERRVQGQDYAYTLQGWLKGMNASTIQSERDMGRDGAPSALGVGYKRNQFVARDAAAFTLGYFEKDYFHIGTQSSDHFELEYYGASGLNAAGPGLYNGNIRHTVYGVRKLNDQSGEPLSEAFAYGYDQLHRLRTQNTFEGYDPVSYVWNGAQVGRYSEAADYDPNGNISQYLREGDNGTMDNLRYFYNDPNRQNRLSRITDEIPIGQYPNDLDDQPDDFNYQYDATGNLILDQSEGLAAEWTYANKLRSVDVNNEYRSSLSTFYYDAMGNRVVKRFKNNLADPELPDLNRITTTYYVRDAAGNVLATYKRHESKNARQPVYQIDSLSLDELHIYGSKRVGMLLPSIKLWPLQQNYPLYHNAARQTLFEGWKNYELTNHLGNVLAVITDRKRAFPAGGGANIEWFEPDVVAAQQYYPFGMIIPGREYSLGAYRYGFNGKENDDELKGKGNQQDYGMRIYDPRVGRFLSVDPIGNEYPELTPYQFSSNRPIDGIDLDGLERVRFDKAMVNIGNGDIWFDIPKAAELYPRVFAKPKDAISGKSSSGDYIGYSVPAVSFKFHIVTQESVNNMHFDPALLDPPSTGNAPADNARETSRSAIVKKNKNGSDHKTSAKAFDTRAPGIPYANPAGMKTGAKLGLGFVLFNLYQENRYRYALAAAQKEIYSQIGKATTSINDLVNNQSMIPDKFKNTADLSSMADILFRGKMSNNQELNDVAMNIALKVGLAEKTYVKTFGGGFSVSAGEQSNSIIYKIFEKEFYSQGPKSNNSVVSKIQFKPASEEK